MTESVDVVQKKKIAIDKAIKQDYVDVFSSGAGKRVLRDIMLSGVMERSAFSTDTLIMAANCAKQDFARHINQMATPETKVDRPRKARK